MFDKKKSGGELSTHKTTPVPTTCAICGFELPEGVPNKGFFVNRMTCTDSLRNNKKITDTPSVFMEKDKDLKVKGDSSEGYYLKSNYHEVRWIVWCEPCYAEKVRKQNLHKKSNQLSLDGDASAVNAIAMMKSLIRKQNMKKI